MNKTLNVLLVEDSEDDELLILREFARHGLDIDSERVQTSTALNEALDRREWDLVISDYRMPRFSGMMALGAVRVRDPGVPFILFSGGLERKIANVAVQAGANAFAMKENIAELIPAVQRELRKRHAAPQLS